jgi:hypothetical protein
MNSFSDGDMDDNWEENTQELLDILDEIEDSYSKESQKKAVQSIKETFIENSRRFKQNPSILNILNEESRGVYQSNSKKLNGVLNEEQALALMVPFANSEEDESRILGSIRKPQNVTIFGNGTSRTERRQVGLDSLINRKVNNLNYYTNPNTQTGRENNDFYGDIFLDLNNSLNDSNNAYLNDDDINTISNNFSERFENQESILTNEEVGQGVHDFEATTTGFMSRQNSSRRSHTRTPSKRTIQNMFLNSRSKALKSRAQPSNRASGGSSFPIQQKSTVPRSRTNPRSQAAQKFGGNNNLSGIPEETSRDLKDSVPEDSVPEDSVPEDSVSSRKPDWVRRTGQSPDTQAVKKLAGKLISELTEDIVRVRNEEELKNNRTGQPPVTISPLQNFENFATENFNNPSIDQRKWNILPSINQTQSQFQQPTDEEYNQILGTKVYHSRIQSQAAQAAQAARSSTRLPKLSSKQLRILRRESPLTQISAVPPQPPSMFRKASTSRLNPNFASQFALSRGINPLRKSFNPLAPPLRFIPGPATGTSSRTIGVGGMNGSRFSISSNASRRDINNFISSKIDNENPVSNDISNNAAEANELLDTASKTLQNLKGNLNKINNILENSTQAENQSLANESRNNASNIANNKNSTPGQIQDAILTAAAVQVAAGSTISPSQVTLEIQESPNTLQSGSLASSSVNNVLNIINDPSSTPSQIKEATTAAVNTAADALRTLIKERDYYISPGGKKYTSPGGSTAYVSPKQLPANPRTLFRDSEDFKTYVFQYGFNYPFSDEDLKILEKTYDRGLTKINFQGRSKRTKEQKKASEERYNKIKKGLSLFYDVYDNEIQPKDNDELSELNEFVETYINDDENFKTLLNSFSHERGRLERLREKIKKNEQAQVLANASRQNAVNVLNNPSISNEVKVDAITSAAEQVVNLGNAKVVPAPLPDNYVFNSDEEVQKFIDATGIDIDTEEGIQILKDSFNLDIFKVKVKSKSKIKPVLRDFELQASPEETKFLAQKAVDNAIQVNNNPFIPQDVKVNATIAAINATARVLNKVTLPTGEEYYLSPGGKKYSSPGGRTAYVSPPRTTTAGTTTAGTKTSPPKTSPPKTSPPKTSPPKTTTAGTKTSPPKTSPPKTSPPKTSPPKTSPPKTSPPKTTTAGTTTAGTTTAGTTTAGTTTAGTTTAGTKTSPPKTTDGICKTSELTRELYEAVTKNKKSEDEFIKELIKEGILDIKDPKNPILFGRNIKDNATYRKVVLACHPDKNPDEDKENVDKVFKFYNSLYKFEGDFSTCVINLDEELKNINVKLDHISKSKNPGATPVKEALDEAKTAIEKAIRSSPKSKETKCEEAMTSIETANTSYVTFFTERYDEIFEMYKQQCVEFNKISEERTTATTSKIPGLEKKFTVVLNKIVNIIKALNIIAERIDKDPISADEDSIIEVCQTGGSPKAPSVKAPSVKAPSVKAPSVKAPSVKAPSVKAPSVKAPKVSTNVKSKTPKVSKEFIFVKSKTPSYQLYSRTRKPKSKVSSKPGFLDKLKNLFNKNAKESKGKENLTSPTGLTRLFKKKISSSNLQLLKEKLWSDESFEKTIYEKITKNSKISKYTTLFPTTIEILDLKEQSSKDQSSNIVSTFNKTSIENLSSLKDISKEYNFDKYLNIMIKQNKNDYMKSDSSETIQEFYQNAKRIVVYPLHITEMKLESKPNFIKTDSYKGILIIDRKTNQGFYISVNTHDNTTPPALKNMFKQSNIDIYHIKNHLSYLSPKDLDPFVHLIWSYIIMNAILEKITAINPSDPKQTAQRIVDNLIRRFKLDKSNSNFSSKLLEYAEYVRS